jgi:hypothetical protein
MQRFLFVLFIAISFNCITSTSAWSYWLPSSPAQWQIQFTGTINTSSAATVFDLDLFDTPAATITNLHNQHKHVICYFSAGTYENWRSDSSLFPAAVIGSPVSGSTGENWVDIRNITALAPVMEARLDLARSKGCDGVSPASVDSYSTSTGFPLTAAQQITYNKFIAAQAHARNLSVALMNDTVQIPSLVGVFDYAIVESCYTNQKCYQMAPFTTAGKAVFSIEYTATLAQFCPVENQDKFNSVRKATLLDGYTAYCPATTTTTPPPPPTTTSYWHPVSPLRWQIQFSGSPDTSVNADVYDVDLFDTPAATVSSLHAQAKKVMCYFSAGTVENWRPDYSSFPASVIGVADGGWAGENWLDVRNLAVLGPIMGARLDLAKSKGCDGIDPDNIDAYTNPTGFPLTGAQQITYNTYLANQAHARGMAIGLKNDLLQATQLVSVFDYALNESCFDYSECGYLSPFTAANKPVFNIEYSATVSQFCPTLNQLNFNAIRKNLALDAYVAFCR